MDPSNYPHTKSELLALVQDKIALFSKELLLRRGGDKSESSSSTDTVPTSGKEETGPAEAQLRDLQFLRGDIEPLVDSVVDTGYIEKMITMHPGLKAASLQQAIGGGGKTGPSRRDMSSIQMCICGQPLSGSTCTSCGRANIESILPTAKNKHNSIQEDLKELPRKLTILTGYAPLPDEVAQHTQEIKKILMDMGYDLTVSPPQFISTEHMRLAFEAVRIQRLYDWCTRMQYELTGWRPAPLDKEAESMIIDYYRQVLGIYHQTRGMDDTLRRGRGRGRGRGGKGKETKGTNKWCIYANLRLIIDASPTLSQKCADFYDTLHTQNANTEKMHTDKFNEMMTKNSIHFQ